MNDGSAPVTRRAPSSVYLCAPVNALVEGIYEEHIPLSDLREHGDFGLGTFDDLDGEMVMLDGRVYQIAADCRVHEVVGPAATPFACVTFYSPLSHDDLEPADTCGRAPRSAPGEEDGRRRGDEDNRRRGARPATPPTWDDFQRWVLSLLPSPNLFYALRIEGRFTDVRVRSVPKQENYRPLVEVAREQAEFTFPEAEGTLAGFFTPSFLASLNVPGLHLHFLTSDRRRGGHLLHCRPDGVRAGVQLIRKLELGLPMSLDYLTWDFSRDTGADLDEAERGR